MLPWEFDTLSAAHLKPFDNLDALICFSRREMASSSESFGITSKPNTWILDFLWRKSNQSLLPQNRGPPLRDRSISSYSDRHSAHSHEMAWAPRPQPGSARTQIQLQVGCWSAKVTACSSVLHVKIVYIIYYYLLYFMSVNYHLKHYINQNGLLQLNWIDGDFLRLR